mmetsp:Transcript_7666/g.13205  ORF Transcript_7666/g.13205 Transcript_7666/m.13205 type:complete len:478 (-) Transcript_7666:183-1616(-)
MNWKQSAAAIQFFTYLFLCNVAFVSARSIPARHQLPDNYDGPRRTHFFDIRNFGAVDDGVTLNSAAFEAAVDAVHQAGDGMIFVPEGRWLTAPFNLTSHCTLFLDSGALVLGTTEVELWAIIPGAPSYGQGRDHMGPRRTSLLHGEHLEDVVLTGRNGTIDGQGHVWWAAHYDGSEGNVTRGHLVEIMYSKPVVISNITLQNSPFWTVHPYMCQHVRATNLTILNPNHNAPNTDGFDPDSCQDVVIEDSFFNVGDDGVAIKSGWDCFGTELAAPCRDIYIRNLTVLSPSSAGVCIGSEMSGGVTNVTVEDCHFVNVHAGLRIKSAAERGGDVTNITFRNISVTNVETAMQFNDYYGDPNPSCGPLNETKLPIIQNITVFGLRGTLGSARNQTVLGPADLKGLPDAPLIGIHLEDIRIDNVNQTANQSFTCNPFVEGVAIRVHPPACPELWTPLLQRGITTPDVPVRVHRQRNSTKIT